MPLPRFRLRTLMIAVLGVSVALVSLMFASEIWAGLVLFFTLGMLSLAVLAVVYRRGAGQAAWLGFGLFGWGYLALVSNIWWDGSVKRPALITSAFLDQLQPYLQVGQNPGASTGIFSRLVAGPDPLSDAILKKLEVPISMSFANETPLEDVLKYIRAATQGRADSGIPIYVDPVGLRETGNTLQTPIIMELEQVPLKTTPSLALKPLGLKYEVRAGLLTISKVSAATNAFQQIGHCYWAVLAGCIGAMAGRLMFVMRDRMAEH